VRLVGTALIVVFFLASAAPVAAQTLGRYELTKLEYTINENRSVDVEMKFTLFVSSPAYSILETSWGVLSTSITNVKVEAEPPALATRARFDGLETREKDSIIKIKFPGGLGPSERLTYNVSFTAEGFVLGSGPEYKHSQFGYRGDGGFTVDGSTIKLRHDNYIVTVKGPSGTRFFLSDNEVENKLGNGLPIVTHMTKLEADEKFKGVRIHFYKEPVYYKLVITESINNSGTKASENIWLDVSLFQLTASQFAALTASQGELVAMYRDEEGKWHGVFGMGTLGPRESRDVDIEIVFACNIYTSDANENNTGALSEMHELPSYSQYLQQDKYWEVEHLDIRSKARELKGVGDPNAYELAKRIVEFVSGWVETPKNENVGVPRYGALWTYQNKYGDCDCFSDLAIALARAAGLPARMCLGWVYREEAPGPHAWVEFYLPRKGWEPADPTWAKPLGNYFCRIDSGHILRGVWGLESEIYTIENKWWDGAEPRVEQRDVTLTMLSEREASQEFTKAAELIVQEAERLLGYELTDARSYLNQSLITDNITERISLAKQALKEAYGVIQELGKPPKREVPIDWWMVLLVALVSGLVAAASAAFWSRRRK
jgi:hypothetical protein